jgi:hypothetical protein
VRYSPRNTNIRLDIGILFRLSLFSEEFLKILNRIDVVRCVIKDLLLEPSKEGLGYDIWEHTTDGSQSKTVEDLICRELLRLWHRVAVGRKVTGSRPLVQMLLGYERILAWDDRLDTHEIMISGIPGSC